MSWLKAGCWPSRCCALWSLGVPWCVNFEDNHLFACHVLHNGMSQGLECSSKHISTWPQSSWRNYQILLYGLCPFHAWTSFVVVILPMNHVAVTWSWFWWVYRHWRILHFDILGFWIYFIFSWSVSPSAVLNCVLLEFSSWLKYRW